MPLPQKCPSCGHLMSIPDRYAGRELFCTACSARFVAGGAAGGAAADRCPSCAGELPGGSRFCPVCGGPVSAAGLTVIPRPTVVTVLAVLQFLGAGLYGLGALGTLGYGLATGNAKGLVIGAVCTVVGALQLVLGVGLWRLRPWARRVTIGVSIVGLLGFPVGTLVSVLILLYLLSAPARVAFSGRSPSELTAAETALLARPAGGATVAIVVIAVLLVVVMVVGIVAAIAIPNLINAIERGRTKRSVADMRAIAAAVEEHQARHGAAPAALASVDGLADALGRELPATDGWRHPFEFRSSDDGRSWELVCLGRDGLPGSRDGGEVTDFDEDLVMLQDGWWQWPQGIDLE